MLENHRYALSYLDVQLHQLLRPQGSVQRTIGLVRLSEHRAIKLQRNRRQNVADSIGAPLNLPVEFHQRTSADETHLLNDFDTGCSDNELLVPRLSHCSTEQNRQMHSPNDISANAIRAISTADSTGDCRALGKSARKSNKKLDKHKRCERQSVNSYDSLINHNAPANALVSQSMKAGTFRPKILPEIRVRFGKSHLCIMRFHRKKFDFKLRPAVPKATWRLAKFSNSQM